MMTPEHPHSRLWRVSKRLAEVLMSSKLVVPCVGLTGDRQLHAYR